MAQISELDDDAADIAVAHAHARTQHQGQRGEASKRRQAPDVPGTSKSTMETRQQRPRAAAATKEKSTQAVDDSYTPPPAEPFVIFLIVSLVGLQLALQTELLSPFFNTLPLTRWSRWVGVFGVVAVSSLVPGPKSLRILLALAALSCDYSVTHGRRVGSKLGQLLGPEWAPAAASALLGLGSLVAVARLTVVRLSPPRALRHIRTRLQTSLTWLQGIRKTSPPLAVLQAAMITGTLWTGEKLGRMLVALTGCIPCRRMAADPETFASAPCGVDANRSRH